MVSRVGFPRPPDVAVERFSLVAIYFANILMKLPVRTSILSFGVWLLVYGLGVDSRCEWKSRFAEFREGERSKCFHNF
jgi:uncharacterized membrane protein